MEQHASRHVDDTVSTATPSRDTVVDSLANLRTEGWLSFQDLYRPNDGSERISFVLVGPGGVVVLETGSSLSSDRRVWLGSGAGCISALLAPAYRSVVRTAVVVPTEDSVDVAANVPVLNVDTLNLYLRALPMVLNAVEVESVATQLRNSLTKRNPQVITTADLLPVAEGASEQELHRLAARKSMPRGALRRPATRRQPRAAHPSGPSAAAAGARPRHARQAEGSTRPQLTGTDVIRVCLVLICCMAGLWFWGTLSNEVSPSGAPAPVRSSAANNATVPQTNASSEGSATPASTGPAPAAAGSAG